MAIEEIAQIAADSVRLTPMTLDDVPDVTRVEARCFTNPWPAAAYRRELRVPEQNYYVVLRACVHDDDASDPTPASGPLSLLSSLKFGRRWMATTDAPIRGRLLGFAGMWTMYDEAHITTIGVDPPVQGFGYGEILLVSLFDEALRRGVEWLTLEVRVSNDPAMALYRKYGFSIRGQRKRYYSDNGEDAHIMWSESLNDPAYREQIAELRKTLVKRHVGVLAESPWQIQPVRTLRSVDQTESNHHLHDHGEETLDS